MKDLIYAGQPSLVKFEPRVVSNGLGSAEALCVPAARMPLEVVVAARVEVVETEVEEALAADEEAEAEAEIELELSRSPSGLLLRRSSENW
jgi:hypothetical protein